MEGGALSTVNVSFLTSAGDFIFREVGQVFKKEMVQRVLFLNRYRTKSIVEKSVADINNGRSMSGLFFAHLDFSHFRSWSHQRMVLSILVVGF